MNWAEYHTRSRKYANQAEYLHRQGERDDSLRLYGLAAEAEANALGVLDLGKTRTLGITVVSAVSLYCKAEKLSEAKAMANTWLIPNRHLLPLFAIEQLEELLRAIAFQESHLLN